MARRPRQRLLHLLPPPHRPRSLARRPRCWTRSPSCCKCSRRRRPPRVPDACTRQSRSWALAARRSSYCCSPLSRRRHPPHGSRSSRTRSRRRPMCSTRHRQQGGRDEATRCGQAACAAGLTPTPDPQSLSVFEGRSSCDAGGGRRLSHGGTSVRAELDRARSERDARQAESNTQALVAKQNEVLREQMEQMSVESQRVSMQLRRHTRKPRRGRAPDRCREPAAYGAGDPEPEPRQRAAERAHGRLV